MRESAATFRVRGTFARADRVADVNMKKQSVTTTAAIEDAQKIFDAKKQQDFITKWLFPGLPAHYPLRKKLKISRQNSMAGLYWDAFQLLLALLACGIYASSTYYQTYRVRTALLTTDIVITQFFVLEFILNWYIHGSITYLFEWLTIMDSLTIFPTYVELLAHGGTAIRIDIFRCLRILRVIRYTQSMKVVREMNGVQRQMITLGTTITGMIFLCASLLQYVENDVRQLSASCKYVTAMTDWQPSCSAYQPAYALTGCDCAARHCELRYDRFDTRHHPSLIRCVTLSFFHAVYFLVVTISTVGYGDIHAETILGRVLVIIFIFGTLIMIPMQISELQRLLGLSSRYRRTFKPRPNESHVIICGHVQNRKKMERFFQEFFHPDRSSSVAQDIHAVVLAPSEPNEDLKNLMIGIRSAQR